MKEKVIVISGPTASGKSKLAISLAQKIDGEIISCDSMQIYKHLDVGTAKVTKEEMKDIKHHLIDICDVTEQFSVADFKRLCYDKIEEIIRNNKIPIIVGGTGLYINSVVYDLDFGKEESLEVKEYREKLNLLSNEELYLMLKKIDKKSADNIHQNNKRRVIRALEIAKFGSKVKSEHMEEEKERIDNLNLKYNFIIFNLEMPRELLYERINIRVDEMLKDERMLKEAKFLYDNIDKISNTCKQAIGYKEFFPYFDGTSSIEECKEKLKQATRNYAKRQITWFKNKLNKIDLDATKQESENINVIIKYLNK